MGSATQWMPDFLPEGILPGGSRQVANPWRAASRDAAVGVGDGAHFAGEADFAEADDVPGGPGDRESWR